MDARRLISRVLAELDAGHASAEEAVRAAIKGPEALRRLLERVGSRDERRPTVRRIRRVPEPVARAAVQRVKRRFGDLGYVGSVHWGVREIRGQRTSDAAVVVHVRRKVPPSALRRLRLKRIPHEVVVRHGGRRYTVRVDVQAVKAPARLHTTFLKPGDHGAIVADGGHIGALGAIAAGRNGNFAITAGHVATVLGGRQADCIDDQAGTFALGRVHRNCFGNGTDISAIGPVKSVPPGATLEATVVRDPTTSDTHRRVSLRLPRLFTPIHSHVDAVGVTRSFFTPGGRLDMSGLAAIAGHTEEGDSGSPALDERGALIGFVIGGDNSHTYLLPARRALDALEDSL